MEKGARVAETIVRADLLALIDECRFTDSRARYSELLELIPSILKNLTGLEDKTALSVYARAMGWSMKQMEWAISARRQEVINLKAVSWILAHLPKEVQPEKDKEITEGGVPDGLVEMLNLGATKA
jgi:hypothetical protein